ncbi:hypothetical protein [Pseudorhodobacter aquimaris]|uniref:hypothetical protein n=1 Tax=Pseudorhodobacter aquimaris TaxID=687412 RepID=UPI00067C80A2|nr:hypothetical protein [Pseudorhodobacter aquimaris]
MNSEAESYLRVFDANGAWIARPDFMIYAAMSESEKMSMEHIYASMLLEQQINPPNMDGNLTEFAQRLKKIVFESGMRQRVWAGEFVVELARLAAATGRPPTISAARRLVAFNHHQYFRTGDTKNISREVERSFSKFRNVSHFHAVAVIEPSLLTELEGDVGKCLRFLGLARAFEGFMDSNVVSKAFNWSPLRVPVQIDRISAISFRALSQQELAAARMG